MPETLPKFKHRLPLPSSEGRRDFLRGPLTADGMEWRAVGRVSRCAAGGPIGGTKANRGARNPVKKPQSLPAVRPGVPKAMGWLQRSCFTRRPGRPHSERFREESRPVPLAQGFTKGHELT